MTFCKSWWNTRTLVSARNSILFHCVTVYPAYIQRLLAHILCIFSWYCRTMSAVWRMWSCVDANAASVKWSDGACSGTVYSGDEKLTKLMAKVLVIFVIIIIIVLLWIICLFQYCGIWRCRFLGPVKSDECSTDGTHGPHKCRAVVVGSHLAGEKSTHSSLCPSFSLALIYPVYLSPTTLH